MKKELIVCDECGKQKGDVNHWFKACVAKASKRMIDGIHVMTWGSDTRKYDVFPESEKELHLCGQSCVIQAVQKWMGAQQSQPKPAEETTEHLYSSKCNCHMCVSVRTAFHHRPQCAMICSDGADRCDCASIVIEEWKAEDNLPKTPIESPQRTRYNIDHTRSHLNQE